MSTLHSIFHDGDKTTFVHRQDNTETLRLVDHIKRTTDRGFNPERTRQHIGEIPMLEYLRITTLRPELNDGKQLEKWLMSDEGAGYRISSGQKARCANIIIK